MTRSARPLQPADVRMLLPAALWSITAFVAALPAWLLLTAAESRLPKVAGTALLVAGLLALVMSAACARMSSRSSLSVNTMVVLLCVAAPIILEVDGRVTPGGWVMFGGAAGALAVVASALMLRAQGRSARR